MQKWEYIMGIYEHKILKKGKIYAADQRFDSQETMLRYLGEQGWELTSVSTFTTAGTTEHEYYYFKRPTR